MFKFKIPNPYMRSRLPEQRPD